MNQRSPVNVILVAVSEQRNLILALLISTIAIIGYNAFLAPGTQVHLAQPTEPQQTAEKEIEVEDLEISQEKTFQQTPDKYKVEIRTDRTRGYINLVGGRIDELNLIDYKKTTEKNSPAVKLIRPKGSPEEYFADFGFLSPGASTPTPNSKTVWKIEKDGTTLDRENSIIMSWQNSAGIRFQREFTRIDPYLFSIQDTVINDTNEIVKLVPYGRVFRRLKEEPEDFFVFHEGFMENLDGAVEQVDYSDLDSSQVKNLTQNSTSWISNTDKYWMTLLYPLRQTQVLRFSSVNSNESYQGDYQLAALNVPEKSSTTVGHLFFAGPKIEEMLNRYEEKYGIENMSYAIDWGWLAPLTKAVSWLLVTLNNFTHNFGLSIIILTLMVRTVMFPLVVKSTKNSRKMKVLAPELKRIKKLYGNSKETMAMEISKTYKKHDVSMLSMILPILIQIPVFFSVYKVLLISIDMRHAPFLYWVQDLSSRDPTNLFTLFGTIDWNPPSFLHVGVWPILVGISFYLQQKFGQTTPVRNIDSTMGEAFSRTMKIFPFIMAFILGSFPAGLMVYWSFTNLLGILQHQVIDKLILSKKFGK